MYNYDYYDSSYSYRAAEGASKIGADTMLAIIAAILIFAVIVYVLNGIFLGKIFKKAGLESHIAWIPFYNTWKFFELGGYNGGLSLLNYIPYVNVVGGFIQTLAAHEINKKLGKGVGFTILFFFLPIIWLIIVALDDTNKWTDSRGKESLAKGTILGYAPVEETPTQEAEVIKTAENHEGEIIQE